MKERIVRAVAGSLILISLLLAIYISPKWLWLTGFVGLNLLQSSFTRFCPLEKILKRLGVGSPADGQPNGKATFMKYYFNKKITGSFEEAVQRVTEGLSREGFGVLTEIDIKATLKKKLGEDFYNYKILGACNPPYAHKALLAEDKIGTMLPCNVIVQEKEAGKVEVAAINPMASMQSVPNDALQPIAKEISNRLKKVIDEL